jgi:hypothetical protein
MNRSFVHSKSYHPYFIKTDNPWQHIDILNEFQPSLCKFRSPISEIVPAGPINLIRSQNGLCAVYDSFSLNFICFLNSKQGEIVRSIYFNKYRNEVIKISVLHEDSYSYLRCTGHKVEDLFKKNAHNCFQLFTKSKIIFPGFVEFDQNSRCAVVLYNRNSNYEIISLLDYSKQFEIENTCSGDVKFATNSIMHIHTIGLSQVEISLFELPKGKINHKILLPYSRGKDIEFIEKCSQYIILKQKYLKLVLYDITSNVSRTIEDTSNLCSSSFLFLFSIGRFVIRHERKVMIYLFSGEKIDEIILDNSVDLNPFCVSNNQNIFIFISQSQDHQILHIFDFENSCLLGSYPLEMSKGHIFTSVCLNESVGRFCLGDEAGNIFV